MLCPARRMTGYLARNICYSHIRGPVLRLKSKRDPHDIAQSTNAASPATCTTCTSAVRDRTRRTRSIQLTFYARRVIFCDCIFLPSDFPMVTAAAMALNIISKSTKNR